MIFSLVFDPLLPWPAIGAAGVALAGLAGMALFQRKRGAILRTIAGAALVAGLANPVLQAEDRAPLKSTVAVVVDKSQSQAFGERTSETAAALESLKERLARFPEFDVRIVNAGEETEEGAQTSTRLIEAVNSVLSDVPPSRVGGAILLTDGQAHDVPADPAQAFGFNAPVHVLLSGREGEKDRVIRMIEAPKFGITGKPLRFAYRIDDDGAAPGTPVSVRVLLNGELLREETAIAGQIATLDIEIDRAGNNILELAAEPLEGEVTPSNNSAVANIDGIRENLRVLLVSGEPHAGERTWRNLLKSDGAVDLIHFTILRPPEKQDGTPINELSLIAFPTRELFVDKINDFDLIIFDRYQHRDVLPILYYDYIAKYVEDGGALLVAAGPEFAGDASIAGTPLEPALAALPAGGITEQAFFPRLTDDGKRHPVTRGLEGSASEPPAWGRWFRIVDVAEPEGNVIMKGPDDKPLLILDRKGKGRVGQLLSDQGWLWARGFEGGGPDVALYRRMAHWLMAEPELEEEALTAVSSGNAVEIIRQSMSKEVPQADVTSPSGQKQAVQLTESEPGLFKGRLKTTEIGLFQIANGDMSALVHAGPLDAPEFKSIISTDAVLKPLTDATNGSIRRLNPKSVGVTLPDIIPVTATAETAGPNWIGLRRTNETELLGINRLPLFGGLIGLALLLSAFAATWWREGR
ncbi:MAG: hypothetical protein WCC66_10795 [Rhizobiaceae bacterium]